MILIWRHGREGDGDAVPGVCKHVRDEVARWLGTGDAPRDPVRWSYGQELVTEMRRVLVDGKWCRQYVSGVRVQILAAP